MKLNYETILDIYTFKRKKFMCLIKVNPKSKEFKNTCRSLSQEQWATFDKKLEKLLTASDKLDGKSFHFNLIPFIDVKVKKSKLSFKHFYKLLNTIGEFNRCHDAEEFAEHNIVFECLIDFTQEVPSSLFGMAQEYEPKIGNSADNLISSPLPYEPYTPSTKKLQECEIDVQNNNNNFLENVYSPKPLLDISLNNPNINTSVPQYTPVPINDRQRMKENSKINLLTEKTGKKLQRTKCEYIPECEYIPKSQLVATLNVPIYIPTPIEENSEQHLYSRDYIRKIRKRSKTIDGFSELIIESNRRKEVPKIMRREEECHRRLKNRSMTMDEIPAELLDMPVYIPTPENSIKKVFKTTDLGNGKEEASSKSVIFDEKTDDSPLFQNIFPITTENVPSNSLAKIRNTMVVQELYDVFSVGKNSTATINAMPAAPTQQNLLPKSEQIKQFYITKAESLTAKPKINKEICKSLFGENIVRNLKVLPEALTKEINFQSEEFHSSKKRNKIKPSLHHLLESEANLLKQDKKLENCGTKAVRSFRRSERSSNKRKELIEQQSNSFNKTHVKKYKPSLKHKDLFGTDDEDGVDLSSIKNQKYSGLCKNPASKSLNVSSTSNKTKRNIDSSFKAKMERKLKEFIKDF